MRGKELLTQDCFVFDHKVCTKFILERRLYRHIALKVGT